MRIDAAEHCEHCGDGFSGGFPCEPRGERDPRLTLVQDEHRPCAFGDCQESCVRGQVSHHALTNLSSNMMANWVLASHHSRGGIFHVCATLRKTRYSNLIAASSVGKCPLVRTARRSLAFKDSMAFVV